MDSVVLATALGSGFAIGLVTVFIITVVTLPMSYVMNRFIYHNWIMRGIVGGLSLYVSPLIFLLMVVMRIVGKWDKIRYFGLLPLFADVAVAGQESGWIMSILMKFWGALRAPFVMHMGLDEDKAGFVAAIEAGLELLPKPEPETIYKVRFPDVKKEGEDMTTEDAPNWREVDVAPGAVSLELNAMSRTLAAAADSGKWKEMMSIFDYNGPSTVKIPNPAVYVMGSNEDIKAEEKFMDRG
jgi:hypothetical protein